MRALVQYQEPISSISLHVFGDASGLGVAATAFAVVSQPSDVTQGVVAAKARLAKQGLTIPRQELVACHTATKLATNVKEALEGYPVDHAYCWSDSAVALHWIRGEGEYKQFVNNRVRKIEEKNWITWRHVPTKENPADLGNRGGPVAQDNDLWWRGLKWLSHLSAWPIDITKTATVRPWPRQRWYERYSSSLPTKRQIDLMQFLTSMVSGACCALEDGLRDLSITQGVHLLKGKLDH